MPTNVLGPITVHDGIAADVPRVVREPVVRSKIGSKGLNYGHARQRFGLHGDCVVSVTKLFVIVEQDMDPRFVVHASPVLPVVLAISAALGHFSPSFFRKHAGIILD